MAGDHSYEGPYGVSYGHPYDGGIDDDIFGSDILHRPIPAYHPPVGSAEWRCVQLEARVARLEETVNQLDQKVRGLTTELYRVKQNANRRR